MPAPRLGLPGAFAGANVEHALRQLLADRVAASIKAEQEEYERGEAAKKSDLETRKVKVSEGQLDVERKKLDAVKRPVSTIKGLRGPEGKPVTRGVYTDTGDTAYEFPEYETPTKPGSTTDYGDFLSRFAKSKGITDPSGITPEVEIAARKAWEQAGDQPWHGFPPIIFSGMTPTGQAGVFQVDRNKKTAEPVTVADQPGAPAQQPAGATPPAAPVTGRGGGAGPAGGGQQLQPGPTADMRNKDASRNMTERSVNQLRELSMRVINKRGIAQRATASGRTVESALGNDPEYRVYQDARMAAAGNLAVLQQGSRPSDADIRAVWLPMIPDVFADTDQSADMKWDFVYTMSGIKKPEGGGSSSKPPASGRLVYDPATKTFKKGG